MAKKAESTLKNMLLSLTLIALVASLSLALVNNVTKGPIEKVNKEKIENAVAKVLPQGKEYDLKTDIVKVKTDKGEEEMTRYTATGKDGVLVGKAVQAFDKNGFGGKLTAMVGFDAEGNITGYEILESSETPGLGAKADKWFQADGKGKVIGLNPENNKISVKKDGGEVDAITGSTITSRAFCRLIAYAYDAYKQQ